MRNISFIVLNILMILISTTYLGYGQSDTIWLKYKDNSLDYEKCDKELHEAFRFISPKTDLNFLVQDFYKNGALKRIGISEKADDLHFIGEVKHFFNDGRLYKMSRYHSHENGFNIYLTKDSLITSKRLFIDNCETGETEFYNMAGQIIATPTYKNGYPYDGLVPSLETVFIDSTNYSFSKYGEGKLIGFERFYKNGQKACISFLNSKITLDSATYYYPTGELIGKCIYSYNNVPMNGVHVEFYSYRMYSDAIDFFNTAILGFRDARIRFIKTYEEGKIIKNVSFDHFGNKIGECVYLEGHPFEGANLEKNELKYYEKQHYYCSRAIVYDDKMENIVFDYLTDNGQKYGKTSFYDHDTVYSGQFENGKPWTGSVFYRNELCQYEDGQKVGWCKTFDDNWRLAERFAYSKNKKNGAYFSTYFKELDTLMGIFIHDEPYSGAFIIQKIKPEIHNFTDGLLVSKLIYDYKRKLVSKEFVETGIIVFFKPNGDTLCTGILKEGKPFSGLFWDHFKLTKTSFENGLLNGYTQYYDPYNAILKVENYLNDEIQEVESYLKDTKYLCKYKNGAPYDGSIVYENRILLQYNNGQLVSEK